MKTMKTDMPGFTADKALNENGGYSQTIAAGLGTSESARQFVSHNVVHPAFGVSCARICPLCEAAGGECIAMGNSRCLCA
jgi:hypothetical protein